MLVLLLNIRFACIFLSILPHYQIFLEKAEFKNKISCVVIFYDTYVSILSLLQFM